MTDDPWADYFDDAPPEVPAANQKRRRVIRWRSKTAFLRWLVELLRRGGRVSGATLHEAPALVTASRDTWAKGNAKRDGRRRTRQRKPTETEPERVRRLAAERARAYRARKKQERDR